MGVWVVMMGQDGEVGGVRQGRQFCRRCQQAQGGRALCHHLPHAVNRVGEQQYSTGTH
jgi:hypothetical protein